MQMIDVLKRLAELDADNPNVVDTALKTVDPVQNIVVKENAQVDECGIMPEMGLGAMAPQHPPMPASINMTAGSGEELSDMLTTIMTLAGMQKHDAAPAAPHGELPPPAVASTDGEQMRSVIDKLNPNDDDQDDEDDQEETDEEYDNTPANPTDTNEFDADQHAHQENQPGQGDRMDGDKPKAYADMNEAVADLFAQYKKFVSEA